MDLKQLQYFVVCAQTGSFSDAAKVLYSTQPSVSKVVKALEDALGMQLFERLPRGIRLTVPVSYTHLYQVDSPFATKMVIFSTLLSLPTICLWSIFLQ